MRIFLISAVVLHREGLVELLSGRDGIRATPIDDEEDGRVAAAVGAGDRVVVVLDLAGVDAAAVASRVVAGTDAPVLAINVRASENDVIACAEAGVAGCLTAEASLDQLVAAIESVARGEALCSSWTSAVLLRRIAALAGERSAPPAEPFAEAPQPHLTLREREIVELVGRGLSNKEIARELCIELPTVKNHVHRILDKLGVSRRAEAAALVLNGGAGPQRARTSTSPA
jgi:two-component system, NarL family, nitrate/nitrite response regulator NarL